MRTGPSRSPSSVRVTGPLAEHRAGFVDDLTRQGYAEPSIQKHLWLMAHLSRWLDAQALTVIDLTQSRVDSFTNERRAYSDLRSERGVRPLVDYLSARGATSAAEAAVAETPIERVLRDFRHYLTAERGLVAGTVHSYEVKVRPLLAMCGDQDGFDLGQLSPADVARFVVNESRRRTVASAKNVVTAARALLRFLYLAGKTTVDLGPAAPTVAGWRGGHLPRSLEAGQADGLLASCDRTTQVGRRDLAILTLLARLGLRASEVAHIELGDFDWKAGEIAIRGKGDRHERLPLPVDVGEAVTAYVLKRPRVRCRQLFLRSGAPVGGLSGACVGGVVRRACARAGIPPVGAHRLRHTAATELLRRGASLPEVGQVLRHRTLIATAIYAKVDRLALRDLARPWPQARP